LAADVRGKLRRRWRQGTQAREETIANGLILQALKVTRTG
jgi:hypothetical protein